MGDAFDNRKNIDFWALNWARKMYMISLKIGVKVYQLLEIMMCIIKIQMKLIQLNLYSKTMII